MYIKEITVVNETGLHARPAGTFVQMAKAFESKITVKNIATEKKANAKAIIGILTMGLSKGTTVEISAEGVDEEKAVESLVDFIARGCDE